MWGAPCCGSFSCGTKQTLQKSPRVLVVWDRHCALFNLVSHSRPCSLLCPDQIHTKEGRVKTHTTLRTCMCAARHQEVGFQRQPLTSNQPALTLPASPGTSTEPACHRILFGDASNICHLHSKNGKTWIAYFLMPAKARNITKNRSFDRNNKEHFFFLVCYNK